MVMIFSLVITFFSIVTEAQTSSPVTLEIAKLFQAKQYSEVVKKYLVNKKSALENQATTIQVNASFEKLRRYNEALTLNFDYLNKNHPGETTKLINSIRSNQKIEGEEYSKGLKTTFYRIYADYALKIINAEKKSDIGEKEITTFEQYKNALNKLEFQESAVEKWSDRVTNRLKNFDDQVYSFKFRLFLDYLSWQTSATLVGPFENTSLLATNVGLCPGVGLSYENRYWAYSSDLSLLYGSGGVSATQGSVTYQQSDVSAVGGKLSLGAGRIVSLSRSELGLRLTLLYVKQSLDTPSTGGYTVEQSTALSKVISIYSRWSFDQFYLQTDFGRYISRPATMWSIGVGYSL